MVVVFGSINVDLVSAVARFPDSGETVAGNHFATMPGGKGANQALAAARSGASVRMFGAVGQDVFADLALANLIDAGVDTRGVTRASIATGCATILVDGLGQNRIVVVAGANAHADPMGVPADALGADTTLVLQQEVPAFANATILARARVAGSRVLLNAAPFHPVPIELLRDVSVLVVNETEAAGLARMFGWPEAARDFARAACADLPGTAVVVTLGADGAIWRDSRHILWAIAPVVPIVDTTGAGDAFTGALAAALDAGTVPEVALARAVAAGTLACTAHGAQAGCPRRDAIDALVQTVAVIRPDPATIMRSSLKKP
ncbi:MAG TPA: ribokinase [Casimicrobiaceae bacterium]